MMRMKMMWNEPLYIDLFDKEKGLPFLIEQIESGNMEKVELMLTDPPYNVDYEGKSGDALKIQNDSMDNNSFYSPC